MEGSFGEVVPVNTPTMLQQLEDLREGRPWYSDGVVVKLYSQQMAKDPADDRLWLEPEDQFKRVWLTGEYQILSAEEVERLKTEWDKDGKSLPRWSLSLS